MATQLDPWLLYSPDRIVADRHADYVADCWARLTENLPL